ncbi:MAG: thymidylate synthase, partial [Proteobacteria bacterium]|nr:thymidylate synthase [Pseudomonadota bacterium]
MFIHKIQARDLPDLWFQAVHDILDHGRKFKIDRGSYAGQTRLEYDFFTGHIKYPGTQPLLPDIPPSCGIPNPVEEAYIYGGEGYERSYIEYIMTGQKEPGESYTYGERLTRAPITEEKFKWWEEGNTEIIDKRGVDGKAVFEEDGKLYLNQIEW